MNMDANTYYLNQHLAEVERQERHHEWASQKAQEYVEEANGYYSPWLPDNIAEALAEVEPPECARLAAAYADDKELAKVVREIVVGYWYNMAFDNVFDSSPEDWE
jgi:hypothetical protein